MSDKALVIAISVILSLVLGAGIYFLVKPATPQIAPGQTPGEKGRPGPFDDNDSPIIIAGGSLYLSTAPGYDLGTMDSKGLYFDYNGTSIKNRYVSFVEITDSNGVVTPFANVNSATPFSLMIDYNGGILAGSDPVTVSYMPVSGCGVITITNEKMNIGTAIRLLPNLRLHHKRKYAIHGVTVNGTDTNSTCADGGCSVAIHTAPSLTCR